MPRSKTTVYLDDQLLRSMRIAAARSGKRDSEILEEALRSYLGFAAMESVWARSELGEHEALDLAYDELHASRRS